MLEIVSSQTGTIVLNRRKLLRIVTGGALAALGAAAFGSTRSARADYTGFYRTTTDLNLRSKPSKQGKILLVIPDNAMVSHAGGYQAPWIQVTYNGTTGGHPATTWSTPTAEARMVAGR